MSLILRPICTLPPARTTLAMALLTMFASVPLQARPAAPLAASLAAIPAALASPAGESQPACPGSVSTLTPQSPGGACPAPNTPADNDVRVELKRIVFKGASAVPESELQALVSDAIGRSVSFGELRAIADRVTARYHDHGYLLAQAVLPVQEVVDGVVEISVVEGRIGRVLLEVDPSAPISEARVRRILHALQEGQPLNGPDYERAMLLLADLPGLRVQSTLEAGVAAGTSDLTVQVAPGDRLLGSVEADNYGSREVGRERIGGTVRWASPLRLGDNLDVRALVSSDEGTLFGRIAYELPLGGNGMRIGGGVSRVSYELGGGFEVLDAVGVARIYDLAMTYPVIRQRGHNLFLRGFIDRKKLTDELRAVQFETEKRIDGVGVGWAWERRDGFGGGGYFSASGALYRGRLELIDAASRAVDQGPFGRDTAGGFTKLSAQASRLQAVSPRLSLFAGLGLQLSDRNLDASEKLTLGGHRAVRAYPSGEVLVDQGAIANVELRYAVTPQLTAIAFHDVGSGRLLRHPGQLIADNTRTLHGPGVGLNYARTGQFSANLSVAWETSGPAVTDGGSRQPRVYLQLQKTF